MKVRKPLAIAICLLLSVPTGCGTNDDGVKTVIGISLENMQENASLEFVQEAEKAAALFGDVKIITMDGGGSPKKQASDIFFLSEQQADAIVVVSNDQDYTGRQMRACRAKGIFIVYIGSDRQIQNMDAHIFTDHRAVGAMAAEYIKECSGRSDAVTMEICCHPDTGRCCGLADGFYEAASQYSNIRMKYTMVGYDSKHDTVMGLIDSDLFLRDIKPDYIFAHTAGMAEAASVHAAGCGLGARVIGVGAEAAEGLDAVICCPLGAKEAVDIIMEDMEQAAEQGQLIELELTPELMKMQN